MLKDTFPTTLDTITQELPEPALCKVYFFHDVRITCYTNSPLILTILDKMLGIFPPPSKIQGNVTYFILCHDSVAQFPVQLPHHRVRAETMRLLTNTKLKSYRSNTDTTQYQRYVALPPVNGEVLSVINCQQSIALTQLEKPEHYQATFLRRYVFLLALGQLLSHYGFEPCHAGAVTAPWSPQLGALIIGPSGSGKTTLSIGCATAGCGILGDDLVMLRQNAQDGLLEAYAVSHEVSIRSASLDLWPALSFLYDFPADLRDKRYCTLEQLHVGAARMQTPIRLLLFPELTTETKSVATPLSKANTLQILMDECLGKKHLSLQAQEQLFAFLSQLAEQAPGYRLTLARGTSDGPQLVHALFAGNAL